MFPHPPDLELEAGDRVVGLRSFRYDLVPRRTGSFEIPALRLDYFDPIGRHYARAETRPLSLRVEPARAVPMPLETTEPEPRADEVPPVTQTRRWSWRPLVAVLALVGALALWLGRAHLRTGPPGGPLDAAERAESSGDVEGARRALDRALRAALERDLPGARDGAPLRLLETAPAEARELAELLVALDRARFGDAGDAPDAATVRAALARR